MNLSPKKIYEKIVLNDYTPTEEEAQALKGTHWHNKLYGGVSKNPYSSFKRFFKEENVGAKVMDRFQLADHILDSIEDQYGLHFSNVHDVPYDDSKLDVLKDHAIKILEKGRANADDKNDIAKRVVGAQSVSELLIRLNMLSKNPLE